ncbi:hypothetical protein DYI25_05535 [Mesobacillus boroniphilus]|uniref:Uncharacterized protein n=1 Tax=Mesobacillus boroniphilus TaxID=308892 RepID=A0A944CLD0_9BACI|nr:hypothetical protein [Mesobacillus boroniphilus]
MKDESSIDLVEYKKSLWFWVMEILSRGLKIGEGMKKMKMSSQTKVHIVFGKITKKTVAV